MVGEIDALMGQHDSLGEPRGAARVEHRCHVVPLPVDCLEIGLPELHEAFHIEVASGAHHLLEPFGTIRPFQVGEPALIGKHDARFCMVDEEPEFVRREPGREGYRYCPCLQYAVIKCYPIR